MHNRNHIFLFVLFAGLLFLAFLLQLLLGSVKIPAAEAFQILIGSPTENEAFKNILLESRLPGALAAILAGAGLSVSGLQMQTMFRNPVAGPYVLGISAGASLGVALFLLAASGLGFNLGLQLQSSTGIILSAAFGAVAIFLINFFISYRISNVVSFLIIGLMIGGGISALIEILQSMSGNEALKQYVLWTFGSFRYVNNEQINYLLVIVAVGTALAVFLSKTLNILLLGDNYAESMGLNVQRSKLWIVLCTSLLAGGITAFCGPIGFVGLAVPHLARAIFKSSDHKVLTPACILIGGVVCGLCNVIAALPGSDAILPINAITSLLGAPVVIWIILRQKSVV